MNSLANQLLQNQININSYYQYPRFNQTIAPSFSVSKAQYDYGTYSFESNYISIIDVPYKNYKLI